MEEKRRKKQIPSALRATVWTTFMGVNCSYNKCFCCNTKEISVWDFECGHIISEKDDGPTTLYNLRPICGLCNKSMGSTHMEEFIIKCGFVKHENWDKVKIPENIIIEQRTNTSKKQVQNNIIEELKKTQHYDMYIVYKQLFDNCFKKSRFNDDNECEKIGMVLKNIYDMDAFILFNYFCSKSARYEEREGTLTKYKNLQYDLNQNNSILIIYDYAVKDNKNEYIKLMYKDDPPFQMYDFAKKIYELANNKFIYKKIDGEYKLYCNNGKLWEQSDLLLRIFITTILYDYYKDLYSNVYLNHPDAKKIESQIKQLKRLCGEKNIIKQYKEFGTKNIEFDNKWWLLGFNNKVLDLQTHAFRDYKFDDYITITTGYDWIEPTEQQMQTIKNAIKQIMPIKNERQLLKQILSTSLEGRYLEQFIMFNSKGRNGKSFINELLVMALGSYSIYATNSILYKTNTNFTLADLDKKRLVIFMDPLDKDKFKNSVLRELTGKGEIVIKTKNNNIVQKILHNTMICEYNTKFILSNDCEDEYTKKFINVTFRSTFSDNDVDETNFIFKSDISLKSNEFKHEHKYALIKLLINAHIDYTNNNFKFTTPESITKTTHEYHQKNYDLLEWVKKTYEFTNNKNDFIQIKELYKIFKGSEYWFNMTKYEKRKNNYAYFVEYFAINIITKQYYREEHVYVKNNQRTHYRNILICTKKIDNDTNLFVDDDD